MKNVNKIQDGKLNEMTISLAALKSAKVEDELVVMTNSREVKLFVVQQRITKKGPVKGGTTLYLRNLSDDSCEVYNFVNELPPGMMRIRRVSAGFNIRTLNRVDSLKPEKAKIPQPEGEFENILDVPDPDENPELLTETSVEEIEVGVAV